MEKIDIRFIPHKKQRYPTCGDWFWKGEILHIRVSKMPDWRYMVLVAVHEIVEVLLCRMDGVTQKEVDDFDIQFEKDREKGLHSNGEEPGDNPLAPYRKQHCAATCIERMLAIILGVEWLKYCDEVEAS